MKTIAAADIESVLDHMARASEKEIRDIAERMQQQQPFVMVYLLAVEEQISEGQEQGWLMSLGGAIFEAISQANPILRQVTGDELLAAEEENQKMLEGLEAGSEMDFASAVDDLHTTYNQQPLLSVVLNELMADYADEPELAPEKIGLALLHLKTVIDCLDQ